jgi:hypothetical protein
MEKIMPHWRIALFAPLFLALVCLQLLSGCILVPVDGGRGRGGYDHGYDRHDERRR